MSRVARALPVLALLACFACGSDAPPAGAEPWVAKPPSAWPQIVLTNRAEFRGHSPLRGASAFLLRTDGGRVLAATAAHLIGAAGGVQPDISISELDEKIVSWTLFPRTVENGFVTAKGVAVSGLDNSKLDWLLLSIEESRLPAEPLRARAAPVTLGEKVFLLGCPYSERGCKQNVYAGKVTARGYGDRFRFDISPAVDIRGFSGAPIVDRGGRLVGVMTVWFEPKRDGELFLEAGGEDFASIAGLLGQATSGR